MSAAPPGVDGAMMRIGRVGQSAACAGSRPKHRTLSASTAARRFISMAHSFDDRNTGASLPLFHVRPKLGPNFFAMLAQRGHRAVAARFAIAAGGGRGIG